MWIEIQLEFYPKTMNETENRCRSNEASNEPAIISNIPKTEKYIENQWKKRSRNSVERTEKSHRRDFPFSRQAFDSNVRRCMWIRRARCRHNDMNRIHSRRFVHCVAAKKNPTRSVLFTFWKRNNRSNYWTLKWSLDVNVVVQVMSTSRARSNYWLFSDVHTTYACSALHRRMKRISSLVVRFDQWKTPSAMLLFFVICRAIVNRSMLIHLS